MQQGLMPYSATIFCAALQDAAVDVCLCKLECKLQQIAASSVDLLCVHIVWLIGQSRESI